MTHTLLLTGTNLDILSVVVLNLRFHQLHLPIALFYMVTTTRTTGLETYHVSLLSDDLQMQVAYAKGLAFRLKGSQGPRKVAQPSRLPSASQLHANRGYCHIYTKC